MLVFINGRRLAMVVVPRIRKALEEWKGYFTESDVEDIYAWLVEESFQQYFTGRQYKVEFFRTRDHYFDLNRFVLNEITKPVILGLVEDLIVSNNLNFLVVKRLRCLITFTDIVLSVEKHPTL